MVVTVRDVRIVPFAIPLRRPLATAFGSVALRRGFLVVLSGADGHEGIGEATPHPAASPSTLADVGAELERLAPRLVGTDVSRLLTATWHLGAVTRSALDGMWVNTIVFTSPIRRASSAAARCEKALATRAAKKRTETVPSPTPKRLKKK